MDDRTPLGLRRLMALELDASATAARLWGLNGDSAYIYRIHQISAKVIHAARLLYPSMCFAGRLPRGSRLGGLHSCWQRVSPCTLRPAFQMPAYPSSCECLHEAPCVRCATETVGAQWMAGIKLVAPHLGMQAVEPQLDPCLAPTPASLTSCTLQQPRCNHVAHSCISLLLQSLNFVHARLRKHSRNKPDIVKSQVHQ